MVLPIAVVDPESDEGPVRCYPEGRTTSHLGHNGLMASVAANAAALVVVAAIGAAARVVAIDARARGRSPIAWALAVLLLGPLGWIAWTAAAWRDWRRGSRAGVLALNVRQPLLGAILLFLAATIFAGVWLGAAPVTVPLAGQGGSLGRQEEQAYSCGPAAAFLARYSLYPVDAAGSRDAEVNELQDRQRQCVREIGWRLALAWELVTLGWIVALWLAAEMSWGGNPVGSDRPLNGREGDSANLRSWNPDRMVR